METLDLSQYQFETLNNAVMQKLTRFLFVHASPEDDFTEALQTHKKYKELQQLVRHNFLEEIPSSKINIDCEPDNHKFSIFKITDTATKLFKELDGGFTN